ncbi:hypothetical protein KUV62_02790 [Salipiger bermudensis]|uniref:hypothetical protein n=1 Tax=Salipiger bermudensis TaxID=344736 RepID=UPI001C9960F5|nr:hypothetical protein [Salipiger bermudensis]MBY6002815.1 hypothetical protein [Salipiger bermudensis]
MIRDIALPVALLSLLQVGMCAPDEAPTPSEEVELQVLPDEMRGRWGLVAEDCGPGRADAKGLMVVTARHLTFYESRATMRDVVQLGPEKVEAQFSYTGEGQTWSHDVLLTLSEQGDTLTRRETGPEAAPVDLTYQRCEGG